MALFNKKNQEAPEANLELEPKIQPLEKPAQPETGREVLPSRETESVDQEAEQKSELTESMAPAVPASVQSSPAATVQKSEHLQRIEQVLEEDIGEAFSRMDAQHQQMFKRAGEDTARQIDSMLGQAKVKVQKIFELIKVWLQMIPGVNKWFIIQESKIKTDKLIHLKDKT